MFHVRQQHLSDIESHLLSRVKKLVGRYVEEKYSANALPAEKASTASLADAAVAQAWGYGIHRQEDVRDFVDLTIQHGQHFEQQPQNSWMAEILQDVAMGGEEKIARILDGLAGEEEEPEDLNDEDEKADSQGDDEKEETGREDFGDSAEKDEKLDSRELLDLPDESED